MPLELTPASIFAEIDGKGVATSYLTAHPQADKAALQEAAAEALVSAAAPRVQVLLETGLKSLFEARIMVEGPAADAADPAEWITELETTIEEWADLSVRAGVGVDGIGEALNAVPGDPVEFAKWAAATSQAWASPVAEGVVANLTPAKVLSAAGVTWSDIKHLQAPAGAETPAAPSLSLSEALAQVVTLFKRFGDMLGASSSSEMADALGGRQFVDEQLFGDEVMRASGLTRLGAVEVLPALNVVCEKMSADEALAAACDETRVPEQATAKPSKKKTTRRNAPITSVNKAVELLRKHGGLKDADLANAIGVSRQAMVKIATGESGWKPGGPEELEPLRALQTELEAASTAVSAALAEYGA